MEKVTHPLSNSESFEYNIFGNKTKSMDGKGNITLYRYTGYSKLKEVEDAKHNLTKYSYDRFGNLTRIVDALGRSTENVYDELNRLLATTNPMDFVNEYGYDAIGNLVYTKDPNGVETNYLYQANNRLEQMTVSRSGQAPTVVDYTYDPAGYLMSIIDDQVTVHYNRIGAGNTYYSDPMGQIRREEKQIMATGVTTDVRYTYDVMGNITALSYPNGRVVTYDVNKVGELTGIGGAEGEPAYLCAPPVYEDGLLKELTLGNGVRSVYDYDNNGRLTGITHQKGAEDIARFRYQYDNANNVTYRNDNSYQYNLLNQLTNAYIKGPFTVRSSETQTDVGTAEQDIRGDKPMIMVAPTDFFMLDFGANSLGIDMGRDTDVLKLVLKPAATTHRIKAGNIDIYVSGDNIEYGMIDRANWTASIAPNGEVTINFAAVVRSRYFKVHCKFDERDSYLGLPQNSLVTFILWPNLFRSAVYAYQQVQYRTETYTYDAVGNRKTEEISHAYIESRTYQYYANSDRLKTDGRFAYVYDNNGNLIKKGNKFTGGGDAISFTATFGDGVEYWEYDYDLRNRLVAVRKSGFTESDLIEIKYTYDPGGLRLMKEKPGEIKYYAFDLSGNAIYDAVAGSDKEHCYVWFFGKTLARVDDGPGDAVTTYYLHTDMLGSVVAVTDEHGNKIWEGDYTPFGERIRKDSSNGFDLDGLFTGKEFDEDTELYYFNARWYDQKLGRFISEDPASDPNSPTLYAYGANNPLRFVDPSGKYTYYADSTLDRLLNILRNYINHRDGNYTNTQSSSMETGIDGVSYETKIEDKYEKHSLVSRTVTQTFINENGDVITITTVFEGGEKRQSYMIIRADGTMYENAVVGYNQADQKNVIAVESFIEPATTNNFAALVVVTTEDGAIAAFQGSTLPKGGKRNDDGSYTIEGDVEAKILAEGRHEMYSWRHGGGTWVYDNAIQLWTSIEEHTVPAAYSTVRNEDTGELEMFISGDNIHAGQASGRSSTACINIAPKANWFSINTSGSYRGNVVLVNAIKGNPDGKVDGKRHYVTHQEQMDYWPGWAAFSDIMVPHTPDVPAKMENFLGYYYIRRL